MFCPKCGNQLKDGALFCNKCGYELKQKSLDIKTDSGTSDNVQNEPTIKITNTTQKNDVIKKKPSAMLLALVGALAFIVILVVVAVLSSMFVKKESTSKSKVKKNIEEESYVTVEINESINEIYDETITEDINGSLQIGGEPADGAVVISDGTIKESTIMQTVATEVNNYQVIESQNNIVPETTIVIPTVATIESQAIVNATVATEIQQGINGNSENEVGTKKDTLDYCTIASYDALTESLDDDVQLLINKPEVVCIDEELAEAVNIAIEREMDKIINHYNGSIKMEEKKVISISFPQAKINDGKRKVVVDFSGSMVFEDGTSKDITASITYNKETGESKISCQ